MPKNAAPAKLRTPAIAQLDGEAEAGEDVEEHGRDHQEREVVGVEAGGDHQHGQHRGPAERGLVAGKARLDAGEPAEPAGHEDGGREGHEQDQDGRLALDPEQEQRREGQGGERQEPRHEARHRPPQTRSLTGSAISPVGRQAMIAITTANANTSL